MSSGSDDGSGVAPPGVTNPASVKPTACPAMAIPLTTSDDWRSGSPVGLPTTRVELTAEAIDSGPTVSASTLFDASATICSGPASTVAVACVTSALLVSSSNPERADASEALSVLRATSE